MKKKGENPSVFFVLRMGKTHVCLCSLRGVTEKKKLVSRFKFLVTNGPETRYRMFVLHTKEGVGRVLSCAKNQNSLASPIYHDLEGLLIKLPGWAGAG